MTLPKSGTRPRDHRGLDDKFQLLTMREGYIRSLEEPGGVEACKQLAIRILYCARYYRNVGLTTRHFFTRVDGDIVRYGVKS